MAITVMKSARVKTFLGAMVCALPAVPVLADMAPDSHAPAGVMFDHLHRQGEWMLGYRSMFQRFDGLYHGGDNINRAELAAAGYSMTPTSMTMTMHMLDIMYAPTDNLTLMLMPQYMTMDMSMASIGAGDDDGDHGGHGGGHSMTAGGHDHSTSGLGDTVLSASYRFAQVDNHRFHVTLGVSAPTGDIRKKNADGTYMHYGMQIGSGTWDLLPSVTCLGGDGALTWGAQAGGVFRLETFNGAGFAFGDRHYLTSWGAYRFVPWASASLRLQYNHEDDINGHYDGPHNHTSPPDLQGNYGGEWSEVGFGVNTAIQSGLLGGLRFAVEYVLPVRQSYNGYQLGREQALNLSLSRSF